MIGKVIYNILSNDSDVNTAVSGSIFPITAPQTTALPFIVYRTISNDAIDDKDGVSGFEYRHVQLDIFAEDYADADDIAEKVRAALDGFEGTNSGVNVGYIRLDDQGDAYDEQAEATGVTQEYRISIIR